MPIRRTTSGATITSGATNYVTGGQVTSGDLVYGLNGGTDYPAVDLASGGTISGATALSGGVVAAAANGTTYGGTAYESGSFAALNQGVVISATITSRAGLAVGNLSGYNGAQASAIAPHVLNGGQAIVGGGFTIKGQTFAGSGVVSGGTFEVGSTEQLASGGTDIGGIFGGTQVVSSGALAVRGIFSAGVQLVQGGLASSSVVSAGGTVVAGSGGTISGLTIGSGGTGLTLSGGLVVNQLVAARGLAVVSSGGVVSGATIASGGSETVLSGGVVSGATILSGGTQSVSSGATVQKAVISAGGSMIVASGATVAGLVVAGATSSTGAAGLLTVSPGAVLTNLSVGWRGRIDIEGLAYKPGGKITVSNGILTVTHSDGTSWSTALTGSYKAGDFHLEADSDGSTELVYDKCFLAGTMIRTPEGERAVETLRVGDLVSVNGAGGSNIRRIEWVGSAEIVVDPARSDDVAGYPVRFRAGALGGGVPDRDLFITPEHCVYIEGALVPARMLVNGHSIAYDRTRTRFKIYHFRTETHAIVWSNNMPTETLLDHGEIMGLKPHEAPIFAISAGIPVARADVTGSPLSLLPATAEPERAAPLRVERSFVEPLHRSLADRAGLLSSEAPREGSASGHEDAELHLVSADGQIIKPVRRIDDMVIFQIPSELEEVRIRSRAARPDMAEGPFVDDRRHLGVLVGDVHFWDSCGMTRIDTHLSDAALEGWNGLEAAPMRWTGGDARLPLGMRRAGAPGVLGLTIKATARYGAAA
ncbi:Hint domain-containing protein [Asaia bogorensis]|uniref:Hint domain-containing protein n=1 Tax=Asaia bogorensis TaxID=91915 RepID=UPI0028608F67|nr:Hint domain-containing protein [Asaia bogorensis]MDR6183781.1 antigen 43 [Asaia bogorensis NBRC 16594]